MWSAPQPGCRLPIMWAPANPKIGEREVLAVILEVDADLVATRVAIRVARRVLAMAAGIWHNDLIGAPVNRSLIAYDH